jgi:hypothetical protein
MAMPGTASVTVNAAVSPAPSFVAIDEMLAGLFCALCGEQEAIARENFEIAPRLTRLKMLRSAVARYNRKFRGKELERALHAMKALEKLAGMEEGDGLSPAERTAIADNLQEQRTTLATIRMAILLREQVSRLSLSPEAQNVIACAKQVAYGAIPPKDALKHLALVKRPG